jgi:peptide chain release factor 2
MNDIKAKIKNLCERLEKALSILNLENDRERLKKLEEESSKPDFWDTREEAQRVMQEASLLRKHVDSWDKLTSDINDLAELLESTKESEHDLLKEINQNYQKAAAEFENKEFELMFFGEFDRNNAIVSISAGSGGTDAQDWAEMLLRMYLRFCEKHDFDTEIIEQTSGEEAGIKSVTFKVRGNYGFGYLKSEHGVHRLVRLSPYDSDNARHTSFALVEVIPEIDDDKYVLDEKELRIDVFRSSGHGGQSVNTTDSAVRITHLPTGTTAVSQNERSQLQNKENALKVIKSKLILFEKEKKDKELSILKGDPISAEWGNQIRSYVIHPYTLIKDNRTQEEDSDAQAVLDGNIDKFIEAYLQKLAAKSNKKVDLS